MPKDTNIQFLKLIHEVFDPILSKYGFIIQDEEKWIQPETAVFAKKDDIELAFRLGSSQLFWYFSLELKLSGLLGERATSDPKYRGFGVSAIAECLNPSYKKNMKASQTEKELQERMESDKAELLQYCEDVLLGDVSNWQKIVDCVKAKSETNK